MGLYTNVNGLTGVNESMFADITADNFVHEASFKGAVENIYESEQNYVALMKGIGISELSYIEDTGKELMYESAGSVSGFFGKLKAFFLKVYEKVKGIFKKFMATLDSFIKSDKDFLNKYRSHLLQVDTKDFKYKGYVFTVPSGKLSLDAGTKKVTEIFKTTGTGSFNVSNGSTYDAEAKDWAKDKESTQEEIRAAISGGNGKMDAKDMNTYYAEKLRNNQSSPEEIETVDVNKMINTISGYKEGKKTAEDDFKTLEKTIKEIIKNLETSQKNVAKELGTGGDTTGTNDKARAAFVRSVNGLCDGYRFVLNVGQTIQGLKMSAMRSEYKQAKAVCVKLVNYKAKNEGYSFNEGASSFSPLNNVVFK